MFFFNVHQNREDLNELNDKINQFNHYNAQVIVCSRDSVYSFRNKTKTPVHYGGMGPLEILFLSDIMGEIHEMFKCSIDSGPDKGEVLRCTCIINASGIVKYHSVSDTMVSTSFDDILNIIEKMQVSDIKPISNFVNKALFSLSAL